MKSIFLASIILLSSCTSSPMTYDSQANPLKEEGIDIMISNEAVNQKKDVNVTLEIKNTSKKK